MEYEEVYQSISYMLYGPIMLTVIIVGFFLNMITIYILSDAKQPAGFDQSMARRQSETIIKKASITTANLNLDGYTDRRMSYDRRMSCFVERKKLRRPKIYIYLLWMTGCDVVLLVCALINFSIPTMLDCFTGFYAVLMPYWYMLCNAAFTASVWLMLSLVRDRYKLLCCRFADSVTAKSKRAVKNIHLILFLLSTTSIFFSLPRFFELDVYYNRTVDQYYIEPSELVENGLYMLGYRIIGSLIFYSAVPYVFTFITSFKIWIVLKNASRIRKTMYVNTPNSPIMSDSDRVIVTLAIRFLVSRFPTTLIDIAESFFGSSNFFSSSFAALGVHASNFIVVLSSASTFFTFFVFSTKFRNSILMCKSQNMAK